MSRKFASLAASLAALGTLVVAAPAGAATGEDGSRAAYSTPTVIPGDVYNLYRSRGNDCLAGSHCASDPCPRGDFCVGVYDPTRGARKEFRFSKCKTYTLAHWESGIMALNNQTGGAVAKMYDRNKHLIKSFPADNRIRSYDAWYTWYIRPC